MRARRHHEAVMDSFIMCHCGNATRNTKLELRLWECSDTQGVLGDVERHMHAARRVIASLTCGEAQTVRPENEAWKCYLFCLVFAKYGGCQDALESAHRQPKNGSRTKNGNVCTVHGRRIEPGLQSRVTKGLGP